MRPIYVPIDPCRLADTRPAPDTVGPRTSPLGPDETYTLSGWGTVGNCTLPSGTAGLALNVTAVGPSQATYLTLFPAGASLPLTSNLNPTPGQPATPNAVNVGLGTGGQFSVFNKFGNVFVIIDVLGYYDDHQHDDRYYRKTETYSRSEIEALSRPLSASTGVGTRCNADGTADGGPRAGQYDPCSSEIVLGGATTHAVLLVAQIGWGMYQGASGGKGACRIERNGVAIPNSEVTMGETVKSTEESNAGGINNRRLNWAGVTVVSGPNTGSASYRVACREVVGDFQFNEISLSGVVTSL